MPRPDMLNEIREQLKLTLSGMSQLSKLECLLYQLPQFMPMLRGLLKRNKRAGRGKRKDESRRVRGGGVQDQTLEEDLSADEDGTGQDSQMMDQKITESLREAEVKVKELQLKRLQNQVQSFATVRAEMQKKLQKLEKRDSELLSKLENAQFYGTMLLSYVVDVKKFQELRVFLRKGIGDFLEQEYNDTLQKLQTGQINFRKRFACIGGADADENCLAIYGDFKLEKLIMRIPLAQLDIVNFGIELKSGGGAQNYALFKLLYNNDSEMKRELYVLGVSEKYVKKWLYAFLIDPSTAVQDKALAYMRSIDPAARAPSRPMPGSLPTHQTLGSSHFSGPNLTRPLYSSIGSVVLEGPAYDNQTGLRITSMGNSPVARLGSGIPPNLISPFEFGGNNVQEMKGDGREEGSEHTAAKYELPLYGRGLGTSSSPLDLSPRGGQGSSVSPARGGSGERDKRKKTPRELIEQTGQKFMMSKVSPESKGTASQKPFIARTRDLGRIHTISGLGMSSASQEALQKEQREIKFVKAKAELAAGQQFLKYTKSGAKPRIIFLGSEGNLLCWKEVKRPWKKKDSIVLDDIQEIQDNRSAPNFKRTKTKLDEQTAATLSFSIKTAKESVDLEASSVTMKEEFLLNLKAVLHYRNIMGPPNNPNILSDLIT